MQPSPAGMPLYCRAILLLILALPARGPAQVVINEIYTGDPDFIEIGNLGPTAVSLDGWTVDASFAFTVYPSFTLPTGTALMPGEFLIVLENSAPLPATITPPPTGTQIYNTNFGYGWVGNSSGAVVLTDANGQCVDYVRFGTLAVQDPPSEAGCGLFSNPLDRTGNDPSLDDVLARHTVIDTNDGQDWVIGSDGDETPGQPNPGQVVGPAQAKDLVIDPLAAQTFQVDAGNGTVSITAQIGAIVTDTGVTVQDPGFDTLVGATVQVNGLVIGGDLSTFGGTLWPGLQILITLADGSGQLQILGTFQGQPQVDWELSGPLGATPMASRPVGSISSLVANPTGNLSSLAGGLVAALQNQSFTMIIRLEAAGPRLMRLVKSYAANPNPPFVAALASTGMGGAELGVIGAQTTEMWNVFAVNSLTPLGTGPFFGIEFGAIQYALALLPLGTDPYHVVPNGGSYHLVVPPGIVPLGWTVDHVAVELRQGVLTATPAIRVGF